MLVALGARLFDTAGNELPLGGGALSALERVDLSGLHPRLAQIRVVVASDVDNPLLGPHGAAAVYGPQKGATPADVVLLDASLARWDAVLSRTPHGSPAGRPRTGMMRDYPGAGAAGGVGYAAMSVLGGMLEPGIGLILDLVRFADYLPGAGLVITGEGALDQQTLSGKAPAGVAAAAGAARVPVVAVSGRLALTEDELRGAGFAARLRSDRYRTRPGAVPGQRRAAAGDSGAEGRARLAIRAWRINVSCRCSPAPGKEPVARSR